MSEYHNAIRQCATRYHDIAKHYAVDLVEFIDEIDRGCVNNLPVPKLCRWIGFVQGVLIDRQLTTISAERDWTRPLFRPLDYPKEFGDI